MNHRPPPGAAPRTRRALPRIVLAASVVACAVLALTGSRARAATFAEDDGEGYVLAAGETLKDNLFAAGSTVTIDGTIEGDLFAAGQDVVVHGTVTGNVFAAGSTVRLGDGAHVGGDLFAGGREVTVAGRLDGDLRAGGTVVRVAKGGVVGGEMMAGGFHVGVDEGGTVRHGLYAGGTQVALDGSVDGDVAIGAGAVRLAGKVGGDADVELSADAGGGPPPEIFNMMPNQSAIDMPATIPSGIVVDPAAEIAGDLSVTGSSEPTVPAGVVAGKTAFEARVAAADEPAPKPTATAVLLRWLKWTLALIVFGLIALGVLPGVVRAATDGLRETPLVSALWGALGLAAAPIGLFVVVVAAIVVALILRYVLLGGLVVPWLAAALLMFVLLTAGLYLAVWCGYATVAITIGRLFGARLREERALALVAGAPLVALALVVPVVGGPAHWILAILGLGALLVPWIRGRRAGAGGAAAPSALPAA